MRTAGIFAAALCATAGLLVAGCASHAGSAGPAGSTGSAGSASPAGSTGSSGASQSIASFSIADKGRTVTVHLGQPVQVSLDTTNWRFDLTADSGVIRWLPQAVASSAGACTVINQCGSVSIDGVAVHAGRTTVQATREKCGEMRMCDRSSGSYDLTIVVTG